MIICTYIHDELKNRKTFPEESTHRNSKIKQNFLNSHLEVKVEGTKSNSTSTITDILIVSSCVPKVLLTWASIGQRLITIGSHPKVHYQIPGIPPSYFRFAF